MHILSRVLISIVALMHIWFLILEMFLWQHSIGLKTFGFTPELASQTAVLAANQGLYNGFLAAGLIFGIFHPHQQTGRTLVAFFLACVMIAGVYGSITAEPFILFVQALPAFLAFLAMRFSKPRGSDQLDNV